MDGLREDHKQAIDDKEEEVEVQKGSEKQEVGENSCSEASTQSLDG